MSNLSLLSKADPLSILSLADAKAHIPVYGTNFDDYITKLIARVMDACESEVGRDFVTSNYLYTTDQFSRHYSGRPYPNHHHHVWHEGLYHSSPFLVELPRSPVRSITEFKYYDTTNTLQTLTDYRLVGDHVEVDIAPQLFRRGDAIQIKFCSGYTTLPGRAVQAMLLEIGTWFYSREDENNATAGSPGLFVLTDGMMRLLDQLRKGNYS